RQAGSLLTHNPHNGFGEFGTRATRVADQDDAGGVLLAGKDEPAEVLVLGQEDASFPGRTKDQFAVHGSRRALTHGVDIVALRPQSPHHGEVAALVREEAEGSLGHQLAWSNTVSWAKDAAAYASAAWISSRVSRG